MDYFFRSLIVFLFSITNSYAGSWVSNWVDGPAPATYESGPGFYRTYVNMPQNGGHAVYTLSGTPPSSSGGHYFSGASSATQPKIATNLKIPVGAAAGVAATAVLTANVSKAALAKSVSFLVRANPYVATALTMGWLAKAGIEYFSDTDTFAKSLPLVVDMNVAKDPSNNFFGSCGWYQVSQQAQMDTCKQNIINSNAGPIFWEYINHPDPSMFLPVATAYKGLDGCSSGYILSDGVCNLDPDSPRTPITPVQVVDELANTPMTSAGDTAESNDAVINDTIKNGFNPDVSGTPQLSGSTAPIQGSSSTSTSPDGSVTTQSTTYQPVYNENHVDVTETTVTTVTDSNNQTTTTVTTATPPPPATEPQEFKTDCDKYPDNIGCSKYGDIPVPEEIPVHEMPVSMSYSTWGVGSCPGEVTLSHGVTFTYKPMCDKIVYFKPMLIAFGFLCSLFILMGAVKD